MLGEPKEWAKSHGVCPLLYTFPKSKNNENENSISFTEQALGLIHGNIYNMFSARGHEKIRPNLERIITGLGILLSYTKRYERYLYKNWERQNELIKFYDEREWRYIPIIVNVEGKNEFIYDILKPILINANYFFNSNENINVSIGNEVQSLDKKEYIKLQNEQFQIQALKVTSKDIKYIIVKDSDEIIRVKNEMRIISHLQSDFEKIQVISIEDYLNDF